MKNETTINTEHQAGINKLLNAVAPTPKLGKEYMSEVDSLKQVKCCRCKNIHTKGERCRCESYFEKWTAR